MKDNNYNKPKFIHNRDTKKNYCKHASIVFQQNQRVLSLSPLKCFRLKNPRKKIDKKNVVWA